MKNIYGKLIALGLLASLSVSFTYNLHSLHSFVVAIYWVVVSLTAFTLLFLSNCIARFDSGSMKGVEAVDVFKRSCSESFFGRAVGVALMVANTCALIAVDSPTLAVFYFLCCICSAKITSSCRNRHSKLTSKGE